MLKNHRNTLASVGRVCFLLIAAGVLIGILNYSVAADSVNAKKVSNHSTVSALSRSKANTSTQRIIVKFKNNISSTSKSALHRSLDSRVLKSLNAVSGLQVIDIGRGKNVKAVLRQYQQDPTVLYAEPDYKISLRVIPDDSSFSQMWGLHNTGTTGVSDADINAPEAWDVTQGDPNVVVAVVDTGIDYLHVDLAANMWTNPGEIAGNNIDDDGNGHIDDIHGIDAGDNDSDPMDFDEHGTHVAGTIGARGNNGIGVTGVNWDVKIIACKIFTASTQTLEAFASDAVQCLDYLYDLKVNRGINIVASNNSWGWIGPPSQSLMDAVQRQLDAGILFVAAAGNDGLDTDEFMDNPSSYYIPNVISVAASDDSDALAHFSNRGKRTVHVAAPGVGILSTIPDTPGGGATPPPSSSYDSFDGTSMATPHVVGLAALLKAQDGTRTWDEIKNLIISSGTPRSAFTDTTVSGRRIRAFDSDNTGAMTCVNQTVLSRLQPTMDGYGIVPGDNINVSVLNVNCDVQAGAVTVTIAETAGTVTLLDDGTGFDQVAGDGIYSAQIDLDATGLDNIAIEFPDATTVYARKVYNYQNAVATTYQWRDISAVGQTVIVGDDLTGYVNSPFDILFGNYSVPFTKLAIDTNGYIVMQRTGDAVLDFSLFENFEIPFGAYRNIVAPFWDDLVVDGATNLMWGVLGSAPNRELVVTWQNVHAYLGAAGITFQVVFKEGSSDVIFNYQDTVVPEAGIDNGISATAGIQVSREVGNQYSYNTSSLISNLSLLWTMQSGVVNTPEIPPSVVPPANISPVAIAGSLQIVSAGDIVTLNGSGTDSDGTIVSYSWSQIVGPPVTLSNSTSQTPSFTAPEVDSATSLTFELTVTDNGGATQTDQVSIIVNNRNTVRLPPGGGGGSFGILFALLLPLFILGRFLRHSKN